MFLTTSVIISTCHTYKRIENLSRRLLMGLAQNFRQLGKLATFSAAKNFANFCAMAASPQRARSALSGVHYECRVLTYA